MKIALLYAAGFLLLSGMLVYSNTRGWRYTGSDVNETWQAEGKPSYRRDATGRIIGPVILHHK